jgi:hypothetical protein
MLAGDPAKFAIESAIAKAYDRLSFRALGYFVIHIAGQRYGVFAPDATMLACSFDEVERRIGRRGQHTAPFSTQEDAAAIADAYRDAIYAPAQKTNRFFGISQPEFHDLIYSNHLVWAPDGDEAFDDWSHVLQFDIGNRVRLIGFRSLEEGYHHDPHTLADMWLNADAFYSTLQRWRDAFDAEWCGSSRIPRSEDGAEGWSS